MFTDIMAEMKERFSPSKNHTTSEIIFEWDGVKSKTVAVIYSEYISY